MEENIKILESFKNDIDNLTPEDYESLPVKEALENLIKGYKELEEENTKLEAMLTHKIKYSNELEDDLFKNCSHYVIPKVKIKERIEELDNIRLCSDNFFQLIIEDKIKLLQELLEEKSC